ncbi:unnamed protein product, partial [Ectocarpus sp. 12 AP-2014]
GERRVVILEIDENATDPRARYYGLADEVRLGVQHTSPKSTKFDLDNLEDLSGRLNEGYLHIGSEHTVISACALGDTPHHAISVVVFASCKARNPGQQQLVFETLRHLWSDRFAAAVGLIVLVASDGDGVRRRLLYNFTSSVTFEKFAEFDLLDATTSEHGVVQCFDLKHNLKRLHKRDILKRGVKISAGALPLKCDSFPQLFRWFDCKPNETYRTLLNPDDRYVS